MALIGTDTAKAAALLRSNELVAIPTETVYGLAANALDANAVVKIFEAKNRPAFDPLIVHVAGIAQFHAYAEEIPDQAMFLAEKVCPGPVTFILKKKTIIPDLVTSGHPTVGLRVPNHPLTLQLLHELDFPLAAPSANPFGYTSPTTAQHVQQQLGEKLNYILDGGACTVGLESTIIDFSSAEPKVLRLGGLSLEFIEDSLGQKLAVQTSSSNPKAPGMLISHYNPGKPVLVGDIKERIRQLANEPMGELAVERMGELANGRMGELADKRMGELANGRIGQLTNGPIGELAVERIGVLAFKEYFSGITHKNQRILSPAGDLTEAARNFFSMLRSFNAMDVDVVIAEWLPDVGLGRAINDRLKRAGGR
jgi:L-threonylcarbamoyladenylate synthase